MTTLVWYLQNILDQILQMLPCVAATLVLWLALRPVRLQQIAGHSLVSGMRREAALLLFVLFCAGLCSLTLVPYGFWGECFQALMDPGYTIMLKFPTWEESLLSLKELPGSVTPFREILRVHHGGPWMWFVLWGNIGMFAPIGFCVPLLWRGRRWYHALLAGGLFSFAIEFIQIFVGRVSDIDDVMLNTAGAFLGFIMYCIIRKVIPLDWELFHCQKKEDV